MKEIHATLSMPPSSNHIYFNIHGGGRGMTGEAKSWKKKATTQVINQNRLQFSQPLDPNEKYDLTLHFYFAEIENKGWNEFFTRGEKAGQRKAETRWKRMDLSNRVKLVEDAIKDAVGVDDSCTFIHTLAKDHDPENPRVEVTLCLAVGL
jgi:Holliday junction resolvase RusA-like endonuclease